ncbi:GNAT family N-acetyltransferase [Fictibacillus phosphorivorans]|uniref:GNAT family N-acetyltransferase n=1 Tax=Fictibacillus phosphorivorans TaxID=1221500 RepID=UPI00203B52CD|nr:GNAT family N-acetyltransferase [Fictibacillus phosphorivorans]MCM3719558.1 GNAT family N-acetyltransferase [Fictibacillus phosphorivorans]MCM3777249.1 GNAT family N-acetyltransferase [Fictibacillus phosphorivorans]
MESKIIIKSLGLEDLKDTFLKDFKRYQVTHKVLFMEDDQYKVKSDHFVDDWDDVKKAQVLSDLRTCLLKGGKVIGAFISEELAGFANIESSLFGSKKEYVELPYIHVSSDRRGYGIGKKMFNKCCEEAKRLGAAKLYIAAHPSVESQGFYEAVGCKKAVEINDEIKAREPLDIQLEKVL